MTYDGDLEHDPGWGRDLGENQRIHDYRVAHNLPVSHLDHIIAHQKATRNTYEQNLSICRDRESQTPPKPTSIMRRVMWSQLCSRIYSQMRSFFGG